MTQEQAHRLSKYQKIADVNQPHGVTLVQHCDTKRIYIQKELFLYNQDIYTYIKLHPIKNMPQIFELFQDDSALIVIEEYISGQTLEAMLEERHRLPPDVVADYMVQLCKILEHLHQCTPAIIHRDLKPSNLMITPDNRLVLLDLNAAKFANSAEPRDTQLLGTQGYAAPEQYGFGASNVQTDIYAMGILMQVLVSGNIASRCETSNPLAPVIQTCTQLELHKRYRSIRELKAQLMKFCTYSQAHPVLSQHLDVLRFLPPGFRHLSPLSMLLASFGYAFILLWCLTYEPEHASGGYRLLVRAAWLVTSLGLVFFTWNYLGIQRHIPFCRSEHTAVKVLGIVATNCIMIASMIGLTYIASIFLL